MRKLFISVALALAALVAGQASTLTVMPLDSGEMAQYELADVRCIDLTDQHRAVVWLNDGTSIDYATNSHSLIFTPVASDGLEEVEGALKLNDLSVWADETAVYVAGARQGDALALFNVGGMLLARGIASEGVSCIDVSGLPGGIYIVRAGNHAVKIMKR